MEFPDDQLMRYADGELTEAEAREVEAAILADASVRQRVEVFRETRRLAAEAAQQAGSTPETEARDVALAARIRATLAAAGGPPKPAPARRPARRMLASRLPAPGLSLIHI